jgi:hypothetical protein
VRQEASSDSQQQKPKSYGATTCHVITAAAYTKWHLMHHLLQDNALRESGFSQADIFRAHAHWPNARDVTKIILLHVTHRRTMTGLVLKLTEI